MKPTLTLSILFLVNRLVLAQSDLWPQECFDGSNMYGRPDDTDDPDETVVSDQDLLVNIEQD